MDRAFVGRRAELAVLHAELVRSLSGEPRVVLVEGPPGVGKTALVDRFLAELPDVQVLRSSGDEAEAPLAFGVVAQLLAELGEPGANLLEALRPGPVPPPDPLEIGARLLGVLGMLEQKAPVIVLVDDAHWGDSSSLQALTFMCRRLRTDEVLMLVCLPEGEDHRLPDGLRRLLSSDRGSTVHVAGLDAADVKTLADSVGTESLSARASERLREHTGGNPLYIRGLLDELSPELLGRTEVPLPAPRSFAKLVVTKLAACDHAAQQLVVAAAVLGVHSRLSDVARLAGLDDPRAAFEQAIGTGLVQEQQQGAHVRFSHSLIRTAIYEDIGPARRASLHALAASLVSGRDALEHRIAAAGSEDGALARELADVAGQDALTDRWDRATRYLLAASRLTEPGVTRDRLLLDAVGLLVQRGEIGEVAALADDVRALDACARRSWLLGSLGLFSGRQQEAEALLCDAWERHDRLSEPDVGVQAAIALAQLCVTQQRGGDAADWAQRAIREGLPPPVDAAARMLAAIGFGMTGRSREGAALVAPPAEGFAVLLGRGILKYWTDDLTGARADLADALATGGGHGLSPNTLGGLGHLAEAEYRLGEWDDALVHAELGVSLSQDADQVWLLAFLHAEAGLVLSAEGRWDAAEEHVRAALDAANMLGPDEAASTAYSRNAAAHLAFARGDWAGVVQAVAPLFEFVHRDGVFEPGLFSWEALHGDALVSLGRLEDARVALAPFEARANDRGRRSAMANAARVRGNLEAASGRDVEATEAFEAGLEFAQGSLGPFELGLLEAAYGATLRRQGRRSQAAKHLGEAHQRFVGLGARPNADRTKRELEACGLRPTARITRDRSALTPQEQAIAALVARGMTNAEVASELVISVKTVEFHLRGVFGKLEITSRRQLSSRLAGRRPGRRT